MFTIDRQSQIFEYLRNKKSAKITELSKLFFIGEATIRRDLKKLELQNLIKLTYGGAVLLEGLNTEIPISVRENEQSEAKEHIGALAGELVSPSDIIIIDSSTTTQHIVKYLRGKENLTIITNGIKTVMAAADTVAARIYSTGGKLRENSMSLVGQGASDYLSNFHAEKLFFSCRAIFVSDNGDAVAMDNSEDEALLRRLMIQHADKAFLLCDTTKINKKAFYRICGFENISCLITDAQPDERLKYALDRTKTEILY